MLVGFGSCRAGDTPTRTPSHERSPPFESSFDRTQLRERVLSDGNTAFGESIIMCSLPSLARSPATTWYIRAAATMYLLTISLLSTTALQSQDPPDGVEAEFCSGSGCTDDRLSILFADDRSTYTGSLDAGTRVPIRVVLDVESPGIRGWSYTVSHDRGSISLAEDSATTTDTIADPKIPDAVALEPNFNVTTSLPNGGFVSSVVLAFTEPRELPLGRQTLCRAEYVVDGNPGCTTLRIGKSIPSDRILQLSGATRDPATVVHGLFASTAPDGAPCSELCNDGIDNDDDGDTDCQDSECSTHSACTPVENCSDGIDNDGDELVDCDDDDCPEPCREDCTGGQDNDGDGLVDCDDPSCARDRACLREICGDGVDNDRDIAIDCSDEDCQGDAAVGICPLPAPGRDGLLEEPCDGPSCVDASLEIVFENGRSSVPFPKVDRAEIPVEVVIESLVHGINGWSYGVVHDASAVSLIADSVTVEGTPMDVNHRESLVVPPHFSVQSTTPEGNMFQAMVLSFLTPADLPINRRTVVLRATYRVEDPGQFPGPIRFADGEVRPDQSPAVALNFDVVGSAMVPRHIRHGLLGTNEGKIFCDNGLDDDGDGLVDCEDPDCIAQGACSPAFIRGDANGDSRVNVTDALLIVRQSIGRLPLRFDCEAASDADGDQSVNITDAVFVLSWLFRAGARIPEPFPNCGRGVPCVRSSPGCAR